MLAAARLPALEVGCDVFELIETRAASTQSASKIANAAQLLFCSESDRPAK